MITSHHDVLEKKILRKQNKKLKSDFQLGTSPPSLPSKKKVALEKSLRLHTCGGPAATAEGM